jgi:replicative DNA helicase
MQGRLDSGRLRSGYIDEDEWGRVIEAAAVLSETKIFIDDSAGITPAEMRNRARRLQAEQGLDLIVVDYLQLMSGRASENRVQEISGISRALKVLARELNVPVVALSQVSRGVDARTSHVPLLSDLRESGSIEQDADVVMFLCREEMYDAETEKQHIADVYVAKHRNGPTGQLSLYFDKVQTRFRDLEARPL